MNSQAPLFSELKLKVEVVLFAAEQALSLAEIHEVVGPCAVSDIRLAIRDLNHDYEKRSFAIFETGQRYQMRTREVFSALLQKMFQDKPRPLSKPALETLAIVAYKQPVTRAEVSLIRGVESSSILTGLKEKGLVEPCGTRKEIGNPIEYKTTPKFLETFGLGSLKELPSLRQLQMSAGERQEVISALEKLEQKEEITSEDLNFQDEENASWD